MNIPMRCLNSNSSAQQPLLGEDRNSRRDNRWRTFSYRYFLMGIIGVLLFVILSLVFLLKPGTASIVTTTTGYNPSSPPKSTTQRSLTSTTSISNELYFEMSEWRDGHCDGKGQCPCHQQTMTNDKND